VTTALARRAGAKGYTGPADRDGRIDILRGIAVVFLSVEVVSQMVSPSPLLFQATGTLSALAFIVVAEGAIVGMVYRPRLASGALGQPLLRLWRSARTLYAVALGASVAMIGLSLVPALSTGPLSALSPDGGARASLLAPAVTDAADVTLGYPVDPGLVLDVGLLRLAPWPLDVLAVLCVLFFVAPAALWALSRGMWVRLLVVSLALYAVELATQVRILPTRAEGSLPILGWQLLFVAGMIAGYYRRELVAWFGTGIGRIAFTALAVLTAAMASVPLLVDAPGYPDVLALVASSDTGWLFEPSAPGPARAILAVVLIVVVYGLLTFWWRPLAAAVGWLLAPLGRHLTAAMLMLVAVALLIASIPPLLDAGMPPAALAAAAVAAMWAAIRIAMAWTGRETGRPE
jgi:hypothetical protein